MVRTDVGDVLIKIPGASFDDTLRLGLRRFLGISDITVTGVRRQRIV